MPRKKVTRKVKVKRFVEYPPLPVFKRDRAERVSSAIEAATKTGAGRRTAKKSSAPKKKVRRTTRTRAI